MRKETAAVTKETRTGVTGRGRPKLEKYWRNGLVAHGNRGRK